MNKLEEYNGYTNKPTWLVSIWIDNDEQAQKNVLSSIADIIEDQTDEDEALYNVAQYLEDMHEETKHEAFNSAYLNSVFSDMLGFILCYVNWKELAEGYIEQVREDIL